MGSSLHFLRCIYCMYGIFRLGSGTSRPPCPHIHAWVTSTMCYALCGLQMRNYLYLLTEVERLECGILAQVYHPYLYIHTYYIHTYYIHTYINACTLNLGNCAYAYKYKTIQYIHTYHHSNAVCIYVVIEMCG